MYWGSLSEQQINDLISLIDEVPKIDPVFERHTNILYDIQLSWFQCFAIEHALISKGTYLSLGTGLGKTATSIGFIQQVLKMNPGYKGMFLCLPSSVDQILDDFYKHSDLRCISVTGESEQIKGLIRTPIQSYDCVVISYKALESLDLCNWIVSIKEFFKVGVLDEAHTISQDSLVNNTCDALCDIFEYKMFLSATPITVSPEQFITQMNMLDKEFIPDGVRILEPYVVRDPVTYEKVDYVNLHELANQFYGRYISWTREELGLKGNYKPRLYLVKPTAEQMECKRKDIWRVLKGTPDSPQVQVLQEIIKDKTRRGLRGLVYTWHLDLADLYKEKLDETGLIRSAIANGEPEFKRVRSHTLAQLRDGELDCIITNLTTSLNIPCDYIVFMENTNLAIQMIGRGERGFVPKDLELDYVLTENTEEINQFYDNVYKRCKWMGDMLSTDASVFIRFKNALVNRGVKFN